MTNSNKYEYINEDSIHEDLICPICTDPLVEPLCADQCGHTFCRQCITDTFREMSQCPTCRHQLTIEDFRPVITRPFLNQLNQLLVKCKWCPQTNIQRGNFKEHSTKCEQKMVSCPAADIKCNWTGQRDKMQEHMNVCVLMKVQPVIAELNAQVRQQAEQIRFLYTILEKTSESQKKACRESYGVNNTIICDICDKETTYNGRRRRLHYCPQTDICSTCVKKHFP
jgi:hypothetical protein